jgi:hypothetical protein
MLGSALLASALAVAGVAMTFVGAADPVLALLVGAVRLGYVVRYGRRWREQLRARDEDDTPDWPTAIVIGAAIALVVGASVVFATYWISRSLPRDAAMAVGVVTGVASGAVAARQFRTGFPGLPSTWLTVPTGFVAGAVAGIGTSIAMVLVR